MAPWAGALGLVISFTADAGTESAIGSSLVRALDARVAPPLPAGTVLIGALDAEALAAPLRLDASLLRDDLKSHARVFPVPARESKGDAAVAIGASFERAAVALREQRSVGLITGEGEGIAGVFSAGVATWNPDLEPEGFTAVPDLGLGLAPGAEGDTLGEDDLAASDGATPTVPRAVALSSTTPAPADATPIEVAAASLALPGYSPRLDAAPSPVLPESARHRYADLIAPDAMDREQRCLAEAVYFEARSESEEGQAAVAQVVLNRVKSGLYPSNVCGVVYQNRHRYMGCQFSFACEGKSLRITDAGSWQTATRIASAVIEGRTYLSEVGGATHYHADYVRPGWSRRLRKMDVIGRHIFYQLKRGQT
ncbi:cell wall hydrolase [Methylobacterium organophilum]|uniref:Cell wall hydrolase SleB domain-containing protein n=1 Tax=Methylobacterium organophilum TaxID=410 RepID=A0ABQ4TEI4_METOR|nr:cell wall hydrolase [Methylobacterium organophilum]GJE28944.1 hypothetical protein LKMONMHP_3819 [Methylobacterium organophilum]